MISAYPLCWPDGWPRKPGHARRSSRYEVDFTTARDELARELARAGARAVMISTNVPTRADGLPYANYRQPDDPGVAVYWDDPKRRPRVIACDVWRTVRENLRAVGLTVAALRSIERSGASELLERAYQGFARLSAAPDHWSTLGIPPGSSASAIRARFHELAKTHHPDHGGDSGKMAAINVAASAALAEVGA